MAGTPEWLERMRGASVLEVATALGLQAAPSRGAGGGSVYGCPACNEDRRHTKSQRPGNPLSGDKRGAVGIRSDGLGWRCFQCDASGDALDLVALELRGGRMRDLGDDTAKGEVREWCCRWLGLDASGPPAPRARPVAKPSKPPEPPPNRPPADHVQAVWDRVAKPVVDVPEARDWLVGRALDPAFIARKSLARALPPGARLPEWCRFKGQPWSSSGHLLVVPMFGPSGALEGLHARNVLPGCEPGDKAAAMAGFETRGLVMASDVGRHLLAFGGNAGPLTVTLTEGEPDYLTACQAWAAHDERAVFGLVSGGWTAAIGQRIPSGAVVTAVAHRDADGTGERLMRRAAATLAHCTFKLADAQGGES